MTLPGQNARQRLFKCKTLIQNFLLHLKLSIPVISVKGEIIFSRFSSKNI